MLADQPRQQTTEHPAATRSVRPPPAGTGRAATSPVCWSACSPDSPLAAARRRGHVCSCTFGCQAPREAKIRDREGAARISMRVAASQCQAPVDRVGSGPRLGSELIAGMAAAAGATRCAVALLARARGDMATLRRRRSVPKPRPYRCERCRDRAGVRQLSAVAWDLAEAVKQRQRQRTTRAGLSARRRARFPRAKEGQRQFSLRAQGCLS